MTEEEIKKIADAADLIVNGYAFTVSGEKIKVLNLENTEKAAVFFNGEIIETSMDDIELDIVKDYYEKDRPFLFGEYVSA